MHLFLHQNKQTLETKPAQLSALAEQVDLVICEAANANDLERLGFHQWPTPLKVAITPFGLTGPKRNWRATTNVLMAMAGHTQVVGAPDREPLTVNTHAIDFQTGSLAYAVANAHRVAGTGATIDISAFETAATHHHWTHTRLHTSGDIRSRHDSDYWYCAPAHLYPCRDGSVCILINGNFWEPFTLMLDRPELIIDERFRDNRRRMENREALHEIVRAKFKQHTRDELEALAAEYRFPLAGLRSEQEVLDDTHLAARKFWEKLETPSGRELLVPGTPVRWKEGTVGKLVGANRHPPRRVEGDALSSPVDGPLSGLRVLDLTHVWAGPLAVRYLADFGATVVKVEAPDSRAPRGMSHPPTGGWLGENAVEEPWNRDAGWIVLHRNRFGLCLDLKSTRGRAIFLQLVAVSDVVVENFSARAMANLGLSYSVLANANPGIIYVTMPGYGCDGPYRDRVAFGSVVESHCGLNSRLGYSPEHLVNTTQALPDPLSAHHALCAIVNAIARRKARGAGGRIEVSLHEAGVTATGPELLDYQLSGSGAVYANHHPNMVPHGIYRCAGDDQWLALACENDRQWRSLCVLLGNEHRDMDFQSRRNNQENIDNKINKWTHTHDKKEVSSILQDSGIPAGPVCNSQEVESDEQLGFRRFFGFTDRFDVPMQGSPIHAKTLDAAQWQPAPRLGEHNRDILATWLGYTNQQIVELRRAGVVATEPPA